MASFWARATAVSQDRFRACARECRKPWNAGYATAGTDTGHQEPGGKWAIGHPEKMIDFAYRSTHEMTLKAKQLVQAFYDKAPQRSYFSSCSTGGRMAVMEAQRYPEDYDGIVAGALANRHIRMWAAGIASSVELLKHPEGALSKEQAALVNDLVTKTCDVRHEGFLNDPRQCKVDFASLRCPAGQSGDACLTEPQLKTVATFYAGVKNSKGELIFSGAPLSRPITASSTNPDGPNGLFDLVRIAGNDAALDWKTFDVDRDVPLLDQKLGFVDAVNPDLSKFKARGGKLLMYHGWGRSGHHRAEHDPLLRIRAREDGAGAGRLGAAVHAAGDGPLPRRSGPQWLRFDARLGAVGRAGHRAEAARRSRCERLDPTALSVSASGGILRVGRSEGRTELVLQERGAERKALAPNAADKETHARTLTPGL